MSRRQKIDMSLIIFIWLLMTTACIVYAQKTMFP